MKQLILLALLAAGLHAQTVWFSAKGKTFHQTQTCMALAHSKVKYTADRSAALAHGLKPCAICYRPKTAKKADNSTWGDKP